MKHTQGDIHRIQMCALFWDQLWFHGKFNPNFFYILKEQVYSIQCTYTQFEDFNFMFWLVLKEGNKRTSEILLTSKIVCTSGKRIHDWQLGDLTCPLLCTLWTVFQWALSRDYIVIWIAKPQMRAGMLPDQRARKTVFTTNVYKQAYVWVFAYFQKWDISYNYWYVLK